MPLYDFRNVRTGKVREFFFHMDEVPAIGSTVTLADPDTSTPWVDVFERLPSQSQTRVRATRHFKAWSEPGRESHEAPAGWRQYDKDGVPYFTSMSDVRAYEDATKRHAEKEGVDRVARYGD